MNTVLELSWSSEPYPVEKIIAEPERTIEIPFGALIPNPSGGGGSGIVSVNGDYGPNVSLDAADVGAEPLGSVNTLRQEVATELNLKADKTQLDLKADKTALDLKADKTELDAKADLNYVTSADSAILGQVNTKADKTYVDQQDQSLATSIADKANKVYVDQQDSLLQNQIDTKADAQAVNQSLSTKADLVNGVIPANQLPSFVDDVLEYSNLASFPVTGESGKIYVALDVNKTYRWSGTTYVEIGGGGVALGETSSTAYRGDRGKIAYDHSQSQGNPHNTTTTEIPEGAANLYFTEPRVRQTPLTGFVVGSGAVTNADTMLVALGKLQGQLDSINQFSEIKVLSTALVGVSPVNSIVANGDTVITAFSKLQGQLNNFSGNFPTAVRNTVLTGLSASNAAIVASDTILQALGKAQGQIDNINQFSEAKVRSSLLTGLTIPSSSSAITASDSVITAFGKLQKSVSDASAGITWVHHSQVGTFTTPANWNMTYTNLYFARYAGMLWIKGKLMPINSAPNSGAIFFSITDNNYKVKTLGVNQANSKIFFTQQEQSSLLMAGVISSAVISDATSAANATESIKVLNGLVVNNVYTIQSGPIEDLAIP